MTLPINKQFFIYFFEKVFTNPTEKRALDYGCGNGEIIKEAIELGYDFWGIESFYGDEVVQNHHTKIEKSIQKRVLIFNGCSMPFQDSSFDFIYSNQVLEHVSDIGVTIRELYRILKVDGIMLHIFPAKERIIEPHSLVPFLHKLSNNNNRKLIMKIIHRFSGRNTRNWDFNDINDFIDHKCFFRKLDEITFHFSRYFVFKRLEKNKLLFHLSKKKKLHFRIITLLLKITPYSMLSWVQKYRGDIVLELRKKNN